MLDATTQCYWVKNGDASGKAMLKDGFGLSSNQIWSSHLVHFIIQTPKQIPNMLKLCFSIELFAQAYLQQ